MNVNPRNHLSLTAHTLGLTAGYARAFRPGTMAGGEIGIGGDIVGVMLAAGSHFAEWIAWEERDTAGDELLIEVVHLGAFLRRVPSERLDYDLGLRASAFLHFDESDDDPGGGLFFGAYGTVMFGWRHFKIGPRLQVGLFSEQADTREFGVYLAPLTARATFIW